ncbi:virulence protein RhuM/Fic/DOC family protein [Pontibacter sp. Tf4]|uniref:virulence protein RhuM/Fic/DOC family protein n=1 Tax=Pontibacter sp. Tf4 TaxID=2761620 RepID=UPI001629FAC3|nr:virulence protein RhuM/Fic/DOC family protein [Pontibacter sp. Tf4]MBB6612743.1 virulence protein RhuM/Fic/DOC family protein [Pontibacter sp. Tf4]
MSFPEGRNDELVIFKPESGNTEFQVVLDSEHDTVWATEQQIVELFGKSRRTIGEHIKNIYSEGELDKESTWREFRQVQREGDREVSRKVSIYNLDVIISVGYRIKSKVGIEFRKWATSKLKEYLLKGYSINKELLEGQQSRILELEQSLDKLHDQALQEQKILTEGFLSIITDYSKSFELLSKYDSEQLSIEGLSSEIIYVINYPDVKEAIQKLKQTLIAKGEASEIFGNEKDQSFEGILGSISQTVFGELAYPTVEEQAAQLLYSVVKGHAFSDGNKRIGSFLFVWFLEQNNFHLNSKGERKINEITLPALALAVAQSLPEQREVMTKLIINMIKN